MSSNQLIRKMTPTARAAFTADLRPLIIEAQDVLPAPLEGAPRDVFFPSGAVISSGIRWRDRAVEVRGIGIEGMIGAERLSRTERSPFELVCVVAGTMSSMPATLFAKYLKEHESIRAVMDRYDESVVMEMARSVACNGLHSIAERSARGLLGIADRANSREFALTHESLAKLLGVRRAGVSIAVQRLQGLGSIAYRLGVMKITDRKLLIRQSCNCYTVIGRETKRIFRS